MSASFSVRSASGRYRVRIARGLLRREIAARPAVVLSDERFAQRFEGAGLPTIAVRAEEPAKDLSAMPGIMAALRQSGLTRHGELLAVGGGVVQDVASFAASIYMRGVRWSYFPTTLLGMVDSCIGGKSSINVGSLKNLVGTFHPPQRILIDPEFIGSLTVEQRVAGLCEAAKICFARDAATFEAYLACAPAPELAEQKLLDVVALSLKTKKWFIEVDEFDRAERQLLNFGHTFGHAIESGSGFRIAHGPAVGIGMLCAVACGRKLGSTYGTKVDRLVEHVRGLLRGVPELPAHIRAVSVAGAIDAFQSDKKHGPDRFIVILPAADGSLQRQALPRDPPHLELIRTTFTELVERGGA